LGALFVRTNIYIDGFNLYYGALRGTKLKWLNPLALCMNVLRKSHDFNRVRYFTAVVTPRATDPNQRQRQQAYLRALSTLEKMTIHYGFFLSNTKRYPVADTNPPQRIFVKNRGKPQLMPISCERSPQYLLVDHTEEKGSDVKLATHLLHDGHRSDYECAVVISNDSDLVEPIRLVREDLGLKVLVLNPHKGNPSVELSRVANLFKDIRPGQLARSQFPDTLTDGKGKTISKPASW
jgi:uncharacterized LabA/DUF88 family protein